MLRHGARHACCDTSKGSGLQTTCPADARRRGDMDELSRLFPDCSPGAVGMAGQKDA
jgi:hypothetical protein